MKMATNEKYIKDIANEQLLSDKEEQELAKQIKIGDAKALEKLTKSNLKFVVSIAHQYKNRGPKIFSQKSPSFSGFRVL